MHLTVHGVFAGEVAVDPALEDGDQLVVVVVEAGFTETEQAGLVGEQLENEPVTAGVLVEGGDDEGLDAGDFDVAGGGGLGGHARRVYAAPACRM
jgi:hypothetical protein